MNLSASEYSNGCASGWTRYLDPFSSSADQCNRSLPFNDYSLGKGAYLYEDEEDEDLSMLSDASSGPPHIHQDEDSSEETRYASGISVSEPKKSKHKKKAKQQRKKQQNLHLDDTASSPVLSFSKASHGTFFENNAALNYNDNYSTEHDSCLSQGFSATHFKGKSVLSKHFGFFKPSITEKDD
ncbi:protein SOB FIVE-LIKE 5 [Coffea arabica]|uniref:Protein SOB FIVE-LIKE 5 n=1 Tax=Coffea arabica TaxID=13443 RepID=A0A6P6USK3_COFAR|nr:uncharacterized protein LOC113713858 [Coffea arabica]